MAYFLELPWISFPPSVLENGSVSFVTSLFSTFALSVILVCKIKEENMAENIFL